MRSRIFSETSYAFSVLWELCHLPEFDGAVPAMPSTRAEGQTGGYDALLARLGLVMILQFKLSDYLRRGRGKQRASHVSRRAELTHIPTKSASALDPPSAIGEGLWGAVGGNGELISLIRGGSVLDADRGSVFDAD